MTISHGTWTPACSQLCASIVRIQVLYGDNMSKPNIRKITADPTKCNTDSSRRPSVFERLGTKPAIAAAAAAAAAAQNTSDYCRNWALNGSCSYGKSCKWAVDFIYRNSMPKCTIVWLIKNFTPANNFACNVEMIVENKFCSIQLIILRFIENELFWAYLPIF